MSKELLSFDPFTGMRVWFDYDENQDETQLYYEQDGQLVEEILEDNKKMANDAEYTRNGIHDSMWHYASLPVGVVMKWLVEDGIDAYKQEHWPAVARKLNDPEYAYLKTTTKKHI